LAATTSQTPAFRTLTRRKAVHHTVTAVEASSVIVDSCLANHQPSGKKCLPVSLPPFTVA
jgi:hypothetical protein